MLKYNYLHKIRHLIKRIPGSIAFYDKLYLHLFPRYSRDGLLTTHVPHFLNDPSFNSAYAAGYTQEPVMNFQWRIHTLLWAANHCCFVPGDFVECGVNRGFMSAAVMNYLDFESQTNRHYYLFDTFCGLVEDQVSTEDTAAYRNYYPDCYEFVMGTLGRKQNVTVIRGTVPDTLESAKTELVAFVHIDLNCAAPEKAALEYFWPKLSVGGIIILDDYGFEGHEAQAKIAEEFSKTVNHSILCLPTGQGMIVKHDVGPMTG